MTTTMNEKPILFKGPMVKAILAGRKTQTRRRVKWPVEFIGGMYDDRNDPSNWGFADEHGDWHTLAPEGESSCDKWCVLRSPYRIGDVLWVRETWQSVPIKPHREWQGLDLSRPHQASLENQACAVIWRADGEIKNEIWRPSIYMPRWASRITLRVTDVRCQRLQEITEDDAIAEGAIHAVSQCDQQEWRRWTEIVNPGATTTAKSAFAMLWDKINSKGSWASNPFVYAYTFERIGDQPG